MKALAATNHALRTSVEIESSTGIHLDQTDFAIKRSGTCIGHIEAERPDANLDNFKGNSKIQDDAFIENFDNLLLTNHFDFRLFDKGNIAAQFVLPESSEDLTLSNAENWKVLFQRLFRVH
jgi:hypothetical protein